MGKPPYRRNLRHRRHTVIIRRADIIGFLLACVYIYVCSLFADCTQMRSASACIFPLVRLLRHTNCIACLLGRAFVRATVAAYTYQLVLCIYIFGVSCCVYEGNVVGGTPHDSNANQMNSVQVWLSHLTVHIIVSLRSYNATKSYQFSWWF